jgi:hypothetical protein
LSIAQIRGKEQLLMPLSTFKLGNGIH